MGKLIAFDFDTMKSRKVKEIEINQDLRTNGFEGAGGEWSRNFGVVGNESSDEDIMQYMVRLERADIEVLAADKSKYTPTQLGMTALTGMLNNNISYNLSADWSTSNNQVSSIAQGFSSGIMGTVAGMGRQAGVELGSAGYVTRKIYKGGTDLSISVSMRLFDSTTNLNDDENTFTNPSASVIDGVKWINSIMIPANKAELTIDEMEKMTTQLAGDQQSDEEKVESAEAERAGQDRINNTRDAVSSTTAGAKVLSVYDTMKGNLNTELGAFGVNLTASPPPIRVYIGKWFYIKEAIVTDASFNFSSEMSTKGPLYCDVTLTISTRENLMLVNDVNDELTALNVIDIFGWNPKPAEVTGEDNRGL